MDKRSIGTTFFGGLKFSEKSIKKYKIKLIFKKVDKNNNDKISKNVIFIVKKVVLQVGNDFKLCKTIFSKTLIYF